MKQRSGMFPLVVLVLLAFGMSGCATHVQTDYNSQAPFATFSTYAFTPAEENAVQSLDESRVRDAVEKALAAEDYEKAPPSEADIWVQFRFESKTKYESRGFTYGLGLFNSPFGVGLSSRPEARPVQLQQLVVELVEPATKRVVWQGSARQYLTENMGTQMRTDLIQDLVQEMFGQYPPGEAR